MGSMKKHLLQTALTLGILLGLTTIVYLYTSGYRLARNERQLNVDFKRTGLINAKSVPEGANVYINDVLYTATDDTIGGLNPGQYNLKIQKNGYVSWEKVIEVFPELVTDITAVLVSQTPKLEPLTNTGARLPVISPSLEKLAFFSKDPKESGIWVIPLTNTGFGLFGTSSNSVIQDTLSTIFSNGKSIEWSPDETELLVQGPNDIFYIVDIAEKTLETTASPDLTRDTWAKEQAEDRRRIADRAELPEAVRTLALDRNSFWAPDMKKFLYKVETDTNFEYHVYNMEKPLPIGERLDNTVLVINKTEPQPVINWFADSFHLILTEGNVEQDNKGTVSLIRIDGTNKTEVYNNTMYNKNVYSAPGGDKLLFLTSFKSNNQTDLYGIGIR